MSVWLNQELGDGLGHPLQGVTACALSVAGWLQEVTQ